MLLICSAAGKHSSQEDVQAATLVLHFSVVRFWLDCYSRDRIYIELTGKALVFQYHQVFSAPGIERQVRDGIFRRNEIGIVQLGFQFLCVLGKDHTIA